MKEEFDVVEAQAPDFDAMIAANPRKLTKLIELE